MVYAANFVAVGSGVYVVTVELSRAEKTVVDFVSIGLISRVSFLNEEQPMSQDERIEALMAAFRKTEYFKWMERQNIPVIDGYGVEDVRDLPTAPWGRTGRRGGPHTAYAPV